MNALAVSAGTVRLSIYDLAGREAERVLDETRLEAGQHEVSVVAAGLRAGTYWYRLSWNGEVRTARMIVLP